MKRIKYYLAALVASVLLLSSCSDSFFDVNVDPNHTSYASPALTLPSGEAETAFVLGGYYHTLGSFWTQQYGQAPAASQWADWESYNLTESDLDRQFSILYAGALYDYEYVRANSAASGNWKFYAISTLMQAYTFEVLADLYDKIPFTDALKGVAAMQPHYNVGAEVYDSLLVRIDNAMSKDFTLKSVQNPGSSDLIFSGDMGKWTKFANTLKLKMYLRYVNVDPNKYKTQIQALLAENDFLDVDAKFSAFKPEQTGYNPYYNTFVDRLAGNVVANKTLVDSLTSWQDPRLEKLFVPSAAGAAYKGIATGDGKNHPTETINNYATPAIGNVSPVYFFSKEEALFLVAEAQERYGSTVDAKATFNAAINSSLVSFGLSPDAVTYTYNGIQSIIEQKWIAQTDKNGIEAFFDYTRTGYPRFFTRSLTSVFSLSTNNSIPFYKRLYDAYPKRLFFPASERNTNSNTPDKVALTVPVWWAIQ